MTRKDGRPRSVAITLPLDPLPWLNAAGDRRVTAQPSLPRGWVFQPRAGYSQDRGDYA